MTTKREEWTMVQERKGTTPEVRDENGDLVASVNIRHAKKGGFREPLMDDALRVARRIAAVPDMEAELLEVRHLLSLMADGDPEWHRGGKVQKRLEGVTAALRKAGRL